MGKVKRRCITCHGKYQDGEIEERVFIEPESADNSEPVVLQGYICRECAIVHWAWKAGEDTCQS